jgi:hypothetical protein
MSVLLFGRSVCVTSHVHPHTQAFIPCVQLAKEKDRLKAEFEASKATMNSTFAQEIDGIKSAHKKEKVWKYRSIDA